MKDDVKQLSAVEYMLDFILESTILTDAECKNLAKVGYRDFGWRLRAKKKGTREFCNPAKEHLGKIGRYVLEEI